MTVKPTVGYTAPMRNNGLRVKRSGGPTIEKPTVTPRRLTNAAVRPREYLTGEEIRRLLKMARTRSGAKFPHRDATMILMAYRHGLRVSELVSMRWDMLDLRQGTFHVVRRKNGRASVHLIRGDEIRALRKVQREQPTGSPYVFVSERKGPMTVDGFQKLFTRIGAVAAFPFPIHPHMLRHACGFHLANAGHDTRALQDWLGHQNIQHTVRYTELTPKRFKGFFAEED